MILAGHGSGRPERERQDEERDAMASHGLNLVRLAPAVQGDSARGLRSPSHVG